MTRRTFIGRTLSCGALFATIAPLPSVSPHLFPVLWYNLPHEFL